jgi:hypothetical protein
MASAISSGTSPRRLCNILQPREGRQWPRPTRRYSNERTRLKKAEASCRERRVCLGQYCALILWNPGWKKAQAICREAGGEAGLLQCTVWYFALCPVAEIVLVSVPLDFCKGGAGRLQCAVC